MIHSVASNLSVGGTTDQPKIADVTGKGGGRAILENHPISLYTGVSQTSAHNIIVGCLIASDGNLFQVLKEAGRHRVSNRDG